MVSYHVYPMIKIFMEFNMNHLLTIKQIQHQIDYPYLLMLTGIILTPF